jgi:hypothetical protein
VHKRDLTGDPRASLAPKLVDEEDDIELNEHRSLIEFSTTSYAILECEQRVVLKVKRRGPIDIDVKFRCLYFTRSFSHSCMYKRNAQFF